MYYAEMIVSLNRIIYRFHIFAFLLFLILTGYILISSLFTFIFLYAVFVVLYVKHHTPYAEDVTQSCLFCALTDAVYLFMVHLRSRSVSRINPV
jgi:hypothetical protein